MINVSNMDMDQIPKVKSIYEAIQTVQGHPIFELGKFDFFNYMYEINDFRYHLKIRQILSCTGVYVRFVCLRFYVPLENFHSFEDVTITGEVLHSGCLFLWLSVSFVNNL